MGRRGGRAASGCYLSWSSSCSSFDASATPQTGEAAATASTNPPAKAPPTARANTPFQPRCKIQRHSEPQTIGTHIFEGGQPRTLWANAFQTDTENPPPCRPGPYVGTAEFSFCSPRGGARPGFGYPPTTGCIVPGGGPEGPAALPTPGPLSRKILESATPTFSPSLEANAE